MASVPHWNWERKVGLEWDDESFADEVWKARNESVAHIQYIKLCGNHRDGKKLLLLRGEIALR